jgi:hypothetical protein
MSPAEIEKRLTKAQRAALLWLPAGHNPRLAASWAGRCPRWDVMHRLSEMGLVEKWTTPRLSLFAYSLAVTAHAVRAELEKERQHGEG